jgi:hypothetical protein
MEKNEKIAFGVLFGIIFYEAVRIRRFQQKVAFFAGGVKEFVDAVVQKEVDDRFEDIVNDTLRDI